MTKDEINLVLDAVLIGFKAERFMTDADYALQDKAVLVLQEALAEQPAYRAVKTYHEGKPVYVAEQPAQKRPQNCGTGYCSCIECVMEPANQLDDINVVDMPVQQEPVTVVKALPMGHGYPDMHYAECQHLPSGTKLYTTPPAQREWIGLTDEERTQAEEGCWYMDEFDNTIYAMNIEAKLKEKNNG
jgi:hypothetical protein